MREQTSAWAQSYDVIIVGAGSMGLAAAYFLTHRGQRVLLLDRHQPPHTWGSHHGETRQLRVAYGEGATYVPLALRARTMWQELEDSARQEGLLAPGEVLFHPAGVVGILGAGSAMRAELEAASMVHAIPAEWLSTAEAQRRWPGLCLRETDTIHFDPLGGVLFSERCLEVLRHASVRQGAATWFGGQLESLVVRPASVEVVWSGERFAADRLVLALGAGAGKVLHTWFPEWQLPLQPLRKTVAWFAADARYQAGNLPAFYADLPEGTYYGFPDYGGGVKAARHDGGQPCDPDAVNRDFHHDPADEADIRAFLRARLPGAAGPLRAGSVCLYTMTPDTHFIVDRHPEHPHVFVAAGFSGHGFKFAIAMGEALACLCLEESPPVDLTLFRADRFARPAGP
ncbi:N-methyl-L-tryptophan oxidase [Alicyclobacillus cellulosilyticus]|uniref:N-methyl-L-tryptophan oxidase n=1 Tax=Alicyclobacillus cellulosilyticus TaxID=1003997 RepID=A0A917KGB8_9BACL|nr:N-methyl-L-tryptophan oxidase [Alicyclobacillus cellulosilyticus]GGJ11188.1 N-methyl-L-tryptophan oxidase [Alicyclobacillus cellulosilyticus]